MSETLLQRMLAAREAWVQLPGARDGLQVRVRRPAEAQMPGLLLQGELEDYLGWVVDWKGFTEADVLGTRQGSDAAVPFDPALWREIALDRVPWCKAVAEKIKDMCQQFVAAKGDASGN